MLPCDIYAAVINDQELAATFEFLQVCTASVPLILLALTIIQQGLPVYERFHALASVPMDEQEQDDDLVTDQRAGENAEWTTLTADEFELSDIMTYERASSPLPQSVASTSPTAPTTASSASSPEAAQTSESVAVPAEGSAHPSSNVYGTVEEAFQAFLQLLSSITAAIAVGSSEVKEFQKSHEGMSVW